MLSKMKSWQVDPGGSLVLRLFRYFSVASFGCVALAALSMALLFRFVAVREIAEFGEYNNKLLALVTLNSVRDTTIEFLRQNRDLKRDEIKSITMPVDLQKALSALHTANSVMRVNIFNQRGWNIYSSDAKLMDSGNNADLHVQEALAGSVSSEFRYRDTFNIFTRKSALDNLVEAYVPISFGATDPVLGVMEIYVDVSSRVADVERAQWQIVGASVGVMGVLYLALLALLRQVRNVIELQQNQIRAHSQTLELLSARMLQHQEDEKKRIAFDLQEGIAQTLSAVKLRVEMAAAAMSNQGGASPSAIEPMVHVMQDAIAEVRSFAVHLRPSSFDDLGLTATLQWFCREFAQLHPEFQLDLKILLGDAQIPASLRIVIFRVIEDVCSGISTMAPIGRIGLTLKMEGARVVLMVEHDWITDADGAAYDDAGLAMAMERVVLSGGQFSITGKPSGGRVVRVSWPA